jgi:hypothetical protein
LESVEDKLVRGAVIVADNVSVSERAMPEHLQ